MGTLLGVLLLPVTGPVWVFKLFLERIRDEAEAMLHDEGRAFAELVDLSMRRNAGTLSDSEFANQEEQLLERLRTIRESRDELLHGEMEMDDDGWYDDE